MPHLIILYLETTCAHYKWVCRPYPAHQTSHSPLHITHLHNMRWLDRNEMDYCHSDVKYAPRKVRWELKAGKGVISLRMCTPPTPTPQTLSSSSRVHCVYVQCIQRWTRILRKKTAQPSRPTQQPAVFSWRAITIALLVTCCIIQLIKTALEFVRRWTWK